MGSTFFHFFIVRTLHTFKDVTVTSIVIFLRGLPYYCSLSLWCVFFLPAILVSSNWFLPFCLKLDLLPPFSSLSHSCLFCFPTFSLSLLPSHLLSLTHLPPHGPSFSASLILTASFFSLPVSHHPLPVTFLLPFHIFPQPLHLHLGVIYILLHHHLFLYPACPAASAMMSVLGPISNSCGVSSTVCGFPLPFCLCSLWGLSPQLLLLPLLPCLHTRSGIFYIGTFLVTYCSFYFLLAIAGPVASPITPVAVG